jgi:ABC-type antimicrobial peptide transport system permease subunit
VVRIFNIWIIFSHSFWAGIIIGIPFGVLAVVIPAKQASKLNIVEALVYE